MKKFWVTALIIPVILSTCGLFSDDDDSRTFYAQNQKDGSFYSLKASLLAEGVYCNVWAENGEGITANTAMNIANIYDRDIYPKMIETFSIRNFTFQNITFDNIMQLADAYTDYDGKLCILLLDIKDDYKPLQNESYVAGYFWTGDIYGRENQIKYPILKYSNECDMIYIDIYPGEPGSEKFNSTLAHEMQHLMNFITTLVLRENLMDTWIDEGLSSAAEWLYRGKHLDEQIDWYNDEYNKKKFNYLTGLIKNGNNFFIWGNHIDVPLAILDDYATVYMFFQWLRLQSNTGIYKEIISSEYYDYRSVTRAFKNNDDWNTVLKTWLAANYINASTGEYGYKGESAFAGLKKWYAPAGSTSIQLAPGEGVYSNINSAYSIPLHSGTSNIYYSGINVNTVQETGTVSTGALLTYNANSNNKTSALEWGTTTGTAADINVNITVNNARSIAPHTGPYRISAGDMLRRNGLKGNDSYLGIPKILRINTDD